MTTLPQRFRDHVIETDECWVWTGSLSPDGYGRSGTYKEYGTSLPHRVVWQMSNGPIPLGMEVDHLCSNRACVRLDHLEVVTHEENVRRAQERRTECRNGHPIEFQVSDYSGGRRCLICRRSANAAYMRRRRRRSAAISSIAA